MWMHKNSCDTAKIFEPEALMMSVLDEFDVVENQVVN